MDTILTPCLAPWAILPTESGLTLTHGEMDEPECTVVFGAGRLREDGRTDSRRVEITFEMCYHARVGPHSDTEGVEVLGYIIEPPVNCSPEAYLEWRERRWRETGNCPNSGFFVAKQSPWLESQPDFFRRDFRHYVVDGRDGYVELIARQYKWREWLWLEGMRDQVPEKCPVVAEGEGAG